MAKKKGSKKPKKIKIELTPLSTFLWSLFLFFLLGWVFFLGIIAERDLLPGAISGIENSFKKTRETTNSKERFDYQKPEEDPAFNFYDNLESKKNEVRKKSYPPKEKEPSQAITLSRDDTAKPPDGPKSGGTDRVKQNEPEQEAAPQGVFSVQIASIRDFEGAQRLIKELVDQDFDAYYYNAVVGGKRTHRIMCGKFTRRSDAVVYLKKLKRETGFKGFIVKFDK